MHIRLFFLLMIINTLGFSQGNTEKSRLFKQKITRLKNQDNLEEYYYAHFDFFMSNAVVENLPILKQVEITKWRTAKSNNEKIAALHLKITLAYHYLVFGNLKKSINQYENALNYYQNNKIKNYDITTYCLKPLGNNYTRIGDFERAEELFKYTIALATLNNNNQNLVTAYLNYSIVLQTLQKNKKAIDLLNKSLLIKGISTFNQNKIKSAIAKNYYLLTNYNKALTLLNKLNYNNYQNQITKSLCYFKLNNLDKATTILLNTIKTDSLANISNREMAKTHTILAAINFEKTKYKAALNNYKNALAYLIPNANKINNNFKTTDLFAENTLLDIFDGKANVYLKLNQFKKAVSNYNLAVKVTSLLQQAQSSQQAKIISQQNNRKRIEKIISIYYKQYKETNNISYIESAFKSVEITKSKVLLEKLYGNSFKNNILEDSLIIAEKKLIKKKANLSQKINAEKLKRNNANINLVKKLINNKAKTTTKLEVLKQQIAIKYPFISNGLDSISILNIQERLLEKNQLLIEYFDTEKHLYIFSITKNQVIKWRRINKDNDYNNSLQKYINIFVNENGNPLKTNIDSYLKSAYFLYNKLLKPELDNNAEYNVTLILDGKLNFVAFDALLTKQTTYTSFKNLPYLLFAKSLNYGYSIQILAKQKSNNTKSKKNKSILGVFPYFEDNYRGLQELHYTLDERESVTKYTNFLILDKAKASKKQFLKNANKFDILHLSTHATAGNFEEPAHIEFRDKTLYLPEIYGLNLQSDLLVLSACETGIGKLQKGEGTMSLARGFLYAGIKNLIVSQWKVNDKSTSILMHNFYTNYKYNNNITSSLHQAKIDYLKDDKIPNLKKTPYYWSGFVFIGNTEKPNTINYFYIVLGVLLIGFLLVFIKKTISQLKIKNI